MRRSNGRLVGLTLLCSLALFASGASPSTPTAPLRQSRWLNMGAGGGSVQGGLGEDDGGIAFGASYSSLRGSALISIRFVRTEEFKLDIFEYSGPPDAVWDLGVLYGPVAKGRLGFVSVSGGLAVAGWSKYNKSWFGAGFPVEAQAFWTPTSSFGLGLYGFADVNKEKSFAGLLFCVQIGRLR